MMKPEHLPKHLEDLFVRTIDKADRRIMVFDEKHGQRWFKADTLEAARKAALYLLEERYGHDGLWGDINELVANEEKEKAEELKDPGFDEAYIKTMPTEELKILAREELEKFKRAKWDSEDYLEQLKQIQKALADNDPIRALYAIWICRGGEYEGWEFEYLEVPE